MVLASCEGGGEAERMKFRRSWPLLSNVFMLIQQIKYIGYIKAKK